MADHHNDHRFYELTDALRSPVRFDAEVLSDEAMRWARDYRPENPCRCVVHRDTSACSLHGEGDDGDGQVPARV